MMRSIDAIAARSVLLLIFCGVDFCFLLGAYGALRALHISVNWVTWIGGSFIIALSAMVCLMMLIPDSVLHLSNPGSKVTGIFAFLIAVFAASQWITRQWYVQVKKSAGKWVIQFLKNVLMFLRKHHQFFGWIVAAGAVGHTVFFLPILSHISIYEEITGFAAIGILALMVLLGLWLWIETALRKQRMPKVVHTVHSALTIAFFILLFLHI
jgi:hypothetical protein